MKIKTVVVTWCHGERYDITEKYLYRSYKKFNPNNDLVQIHFNRHHYGKLEEEFGHRFGWQSDFILYRIFLLLEKIKMIDADYLVFTDIGDTTCLGNVEELPDLFDLKNHIVFGMEKNQWPPVDRKNTWPDYKDYSGFDGNNQFYINASNILTSKAKYIELLESVINNILSKNINQMTSDQGVYTYHYNMKLFPRVTLDYASVFTVNTFRRTKEEYYLSNEKLYSRDFGTTPYFVHDNGWDHGSPKYALAFELEKLYS